MAPKSKARSAKKRPAKAALPATKEKSQRERFVEAARERGVTNEGFERLFRQAVWPKRR